MNNDLFNLEQETAIVIGGTGTLGGAMATALAGAGARVVIVGRSEERGQESLVFAEHTHIPVAMPPPGILHVTVINAVLEFPNELYVVDSLVS